MKWLLLALVIAGALMLLYATTRHNHTLIAIIARETISISGAWSIYLLVVKWAEEYQKLHPKVKLDISAGGTGNGVTDTFPDAVDIGMVSRKIKPAAKTKGSTQDRA